MAKDPTAGWLPPPSGRHRIVATAFAIAFVLAFLAIRTHLVNPFGGR